MNRKLSEDDKKQIEHIYPDTPNKVIALMYHVSLSRIKNLASEMLWRKDKNYKAEILKRQGKLISDIRWNK